MNEFPEPSYAERPPAKPLPKRIEKQVIALGNESRDWGILPHFNNWNGDVLAPHPSVAGNPDFDWQTVFRNLDGDECPIEKQDDTQRLAMKLSGALWKRIGDWILDVKLNDRHAFRKISIRTIAMCWVIDPNRFKGESLAKIARRMGFKGANSISPSAAEFSRKFGITNHFQKHNWRNN